MGSRGRERVPGHNPNPLRAKSKYLIVLPNERRVEQVVFDHARHRQLVWRKAHLAGARVPLFVAWLLLDETAAVGRAAEAFLLGLRSKIVGQAGHMQVSSSTERCGTEWAIYSQGLHAGVTWIRTTSSLKDWKL